MNYHNLYLLYKLKYHQLKKKSSLIGGMDPKPNPWGKVTTNPSSAESPFISLIAERDAKLARMKEIEEQVQFKKEQERIEKERIQQETEEKIKAQQLAEEIRLEQVRIKREDDLQSLRLPSEVIDRMMEVDNIDLYSLINSIKKPELKKTIKTFIIENIINKNISIEEIYIIYNKFYNVRHEIEDIIINEKIINPDDLYFIFTNFSNKKIKGIIYDKVCNMEVKKLAAHNLVLLYKIINKNSLLELINNKIKEKNISIFDLVTLYSLDEFKEFLKPLINDTYDSKFKLISKIYNPSLIEFIKLKYIIIYFLCQRMIGLDKKHNTYKLQIEYNGYSSITSSVFKIIFTYSHNIDNTIIETRIDTGAIRNLGEYNFDNLLNGIMTQLNQQNKKEISIKNISIKDFNKKNILNFNLNFE
jgi:hypothetical protein